MNSLTKTKKDGYAMKEKSSINNTEKTTQPHAKTDTELSYSINQKLTKVD